MNCYLTKILFKKGDTILVFIGIVIAAYMTISYNIIHDLLIDPKTNIMPITVAGLASLGVGSLLFYLFVRGKIKSID